MKFTRKFLDGYITYDEDDVIVHANSFLGYIFKSIVAIIYMAQYFVSYTPHLRIVFWCKTSQR